MDLNGFNNQLQISKQAHGFAVSTGGYGTGMGKDAISRANLGDDDTVPLRVIFGCIQPQQGSKTIVLDVLKPLAELSPFLADDKKRGCP